MKILHNNFSLKFVIHSQFLHYFIACNVIQFVQSDIADKKAVFSFFYPVFFHAAKFLCNSPIDLFVWSSYHFLESMQFGGIKAINVFVLLLFYYFYNFYI